MTTVETKPTPLPTLDDVYHSFLEVLAIDDIPQDIRNNAIFKILEDKHHNEVLVAGQFLVGLWEKEWDEIQKPVVGKDLSVALHMKAFLAQLGKPIPTSLKEYLGEFTL